MTLAEYITANLATRFAWGSFDCVLFAVGWLNIATGKDYLVDIPRWTDAKQAMRIIEGLGGLEAAIDAHLERIDPRMAKDGDIALYKGAMCLFSGPHIVGPSENGLQFINRTHAECAWSI